MVRPEWSDWSDLCGVEVKVVWSTTGIHLIRACYLNSTHIVEIAQELFQNNSTMER